MCTFQKKSGRAWNKKAQVQDGIALTNDTNAPFHLKFGKGIQGSSWLGFVTQSSSVAQEAAG